jgi:hypothetical protein
VPFACKITGEVHFGWPVIFLFILDVCVTLGMLVWLTGQPLERIQQDTDQDLFMSTQEATSYGLIDKAIDKRPIRPV